jgi:expansin (peptidoglycan-binding protein)
MKNAAFFFLTSILCFGQGSSIYSQTKQVLVASSRSVDVIASSASDRISIQKLTRYKTGSPNSLAGNQPLDSIAVHLNPGWNLSSVPILTDDPGVTKIFPSTIKIAFGYNGSYVKAESLSVGAGYWLHCDSAVTQVISGLSILVDTITVVKGWNLIGSVSQTIPVSAVESSPAGIVASKFFGYEDGSYYAADTIQPGAGYWVNVDSDGMLILSSRDDIPSCSPVQATHSGDGTFYSFADGGGNCLFDPTPNDLMVGAMNQTDYAGSAICGACLSLTGPNAEIFIRVVDRCPECKPGDIDLSPFAFSKIADTALGRVHISWHLVACNVSGPIVYHFKDGSSQWWTAVQIRNHRYPIMSVEYLTSEGAFKLVNRVDYNYFVEPSGMGPGPYTFRVTDMFGHALVDSGIVLQVNGDVPGTGQFPLCGSQ